MRNKPSVPGYAGPHLTPLKAIAAFCRQCFGGQAKDCASTGCPFWPYRQGTIPEGASRQMVRIIKSYCAGCLPAENPKDCSACVEYRGLAPCPCWPYRLGRNPYIGPEVREMRRRRAVEQYQLAGGEARFRPRTDARPTA